MKRNQKLIDKKFQLTTTFKILGVTLIAFLIIIAIIGISATRNSHNLSKTIIELTQIVKSEENLVKTFNEFSSIKSNGNLILQSKKISNDHEINMNKIKDHINQLNTSIEKNYQLLIIIIGTIVLLAICLYFYLLNITHRISGPLYVMTRHMQEILDGKDVQFRKLRDKDELKEFYEKFIQIADKFNPPQ